MTQPSPTGDAARPRTPVVRPKLSLGLLSVAHAVNHGQAVLLPLVFLAVIDEFHVGADTIAFLAAIGNVSGGLIQITFGPLSRAVSRRSLLGIGGLLFGGGFAAQAAAGTFPAFSVANVVSRIGSAPQHPVGNGLLAEQFSRERRGFAISAHISGGNVGTVLFGVSAPWLMAQLGWRGVSLFLGLPTIAVTILLVGLVRERGTDRAAAVAHGTIRDAYRAILGTRDLLWIFAASVLGGGGRGLGVVNLFVLLYLTRVVGLAADTTNLMYAALIVMSVPAPLLAGWLSDRYGRRPLIVGVYVAGALGFVVFVLAGSSLAGLWLGIAIMGVFSFAESPQLQAFVADLAPAAIRDVAFATYFTLAFGVGSLWTALYGAILDAAGDRAGLPIVFWLMAAAFLAAALAVLPIREGVRRHESPEDVEPIV